MHMATQVQFRRGTTSEHTSFIGASGEVTVDTTLTTLKVHDGSTAGGIRIAKYSDIAAHTMTFSDTASTSLTLTPGASDIKFKGTSLTPVITGDTLSYNLDSDIIVNSISSTDSAAVLINDNLAITGSLKAEGSTSIQIDDGINVAGNIFSSGDITTNGTLQVNTIESQDSTSVLFSDGITVSGAIKADDSGTINIDDALDVEGVITSGAITSSGVVTGTGFTIGSAAIDETDLEKIDGITNGAGAANKALVLDGSANIASGLAAVTASGVITAAGFTIGSAVINETDLEKIDGITNGAGAANKALVLDGSANIASGLAAVTASGVITAAGFTIGSAVINEAELETIDGVTAGTVAASKAVVVDSDKDITGGRNITLSGTLHTTILDVREINSTDSTAVVINEALEVAGALTSGAITSSGVVTGTGFTIGSAVIDETDLEKLDGITNGAGAANKALVLDASADVASGLAALTASGVITAAGFTIGSAVINETDLEKIDGITNGAGAANKALVLDGSASVASGLAALTASGVVTAAGFTIGSAAIVEAELEMIDGITAGTAAASKALVLDSDKDIGTIRNITSNGTIQFGSLSDGTITATAFVDEDNMSSNSATLIPTQQSVKAYVDNEVGASANINFSDLSSNTGNVAFASEEIVFAGGNGITSAVIAGSNTVTHSLDTIVDLDVISSSDSTFVTVNDGLNVNGNFQTTSGTGLFGGIVTAAGFTIGSAAMNEADLEKIDGITNGAGAANKALVLDGDADVASGLRNLTASGTITGDLTGDVTGNADTATVLATARTLGGVSFNGSANINLPGVNSAGNQNTSGTAALATAVTVTANNTADENVFITFVDGATGTQGIETDTNLTYNPNTNVIASTASAAQYSDLAEKYVSDAQYEPGTVVIFGGDNEVTTTTLSHDTRVAGVVSTAPAYLMNSSLEATYVIDLALTGRVPCKVKGVVAKGDIIVASNVEGVGTKLNTSSYQIGCVIGKALESKDTSDIGVIEVVVGRL